MKDLGVHLMSVGRDSMDTDSKGHMCCVKCGWSWQKNVFRSYSLLVDKLLVFLNDLAKNQQIVFICILFHSGNRVFLAFSGILLDGS